MNGDRTAFGPLPDETLDELQPWRLRILQKKQGFRFGMDAVLLADFALIRPGDRVADFGTGTGILPLLLHAREKGDSFDAFELQAEMAEMAERTMALNGLTDRIRLHHASVTEAQTLLRPCAVDAVVCNPPYGAPGKTMPNPSSGRSISRHQPEEGLLPWYRAAHSILRGKGRMAMIYPAPFLMDALNGLTEAHLTPKRLRLVHPRADRPANLALIEAVKDGRPPLTVEPPLIVAEADGTYTADLRRIYHTDERREGQAACGQ